MRCRMCEREVQDGARFCPWCGSAIAYGEPLSTPVAECLGVPGEGMGDASAVGAVRPARTKGDGIRLALSFLGVFFAFVMEAVGAILSLVFEVDMELMSLLFGFLGAAGVLLVLGGARMLRPRMKAILSVLRQGWWAIFVSAGLGVFELVTYIMEDAVVIDEGTLGRLVYITVLCLLVGLFEEAAFRGILQGGFMAAFGGTKRGLFVAVIVMSLAFGAAHVMWSDLDITDSLQVAQAFLKVIQTGVYAVFLSSQVIRTREIWGVGLLHGLDDWLLLVVSVVLGGESLETEYVVVGDDAVPTILLYLVVIALYTPLLVRAIKAIRKTTVPDYGPMIEG